MKYLIDSICEFILSYARAVRTYLFVKNKPLFRSQEEEKSWKRYKLFGFKLDKQNANNNLYWKWKFSRFRSLIQDIKISIIQTYNNS